MSSLQQLLPPRVSRAVACCALPALCGLVILHVLSPDLGARSAVAGAAALVATSASPTGQPSPAYTVAATASPASTAIAARATTAVPAPTATPLRVFVPHTVSEAPSLPEALAEGQQVLVPHVVAALVNESPLTTPTPAPAPTAVPPPVPTRTPEPTPTALPQPTPDGVERQATVPILMYHHVGDTQPEDDAIRRGLTVSPDALRWQLDYLKQNGFQVVSLEAIVRQLALGEPLPERAVALTFDDGYRDCYDVAYPILKEYGVTATFFLVTAPIDQGDPEFLSWDQVREMSAAGMEFGAHTYTHPDLTDQTTDYVVWQVVGSSQAIEERTGRPTRFFAYPSGAYDENAMAVVRSAGFWMAVTTEFDCTLTSSSLFSLPRVRVRPQDSHAVFARKLTECAE